MTKYDEMVAWWRDHPIATAPYEYPTPWDSRIFAPLGPRRQPAVFAVEDLRSGTGVGAFDMKPAAGKSGHQGAALDRIDRPGAVRPSASRVQCLLQGRRKTGPGVG